MIVAWIVPHILMYNNYVVYLSCRIMIVFVKKVRKLMITLFGYIHPIKLLYLLDTLHHMIRC